MKFCLIINPSDRWKDSLRHAFTMVTTMIDEGHEVNAVFFYGQAVQVLKHNKSLQQWQQWQTGSSCQLMLCSTLLESYDLTNDATNAEGFVAVGMASWAKAMETADKTLELC